MRQKNFATILKNELLQPFTSPGCWKKCVVVFLLFIGIFLLLSPPIHHVSPPMPRIFQSVLPELLVSDPFPLPDKLKPQVDFWKKIFTEYTTKQVVLHDSWYVNVTYEVIDLESSEFATERDGWNAVKAAQKKYEKLLENLAKQWETPQKMTKEERKIYALFQNIPESPRFKKKDAKDRVRAQVGQADRFKEGIIRAGNYLDAMKCILEEYDLPETLAYLPLIESAFNPFAESYVGALGIWQFMRGTGKHYNLKITPFVDERKDPLISTRAAAQLLAYNYKIIQSWPLAITAYNHGLQGIKNAVKQVGSEDIADIVEHYNGPRFGFSSRNFYAEFLAALDVCRRYTEYFGEIEIHEPLSLAQVKLPDYVSIKTLEQYTQLTGSDIKKLNPALHPSVFRPGNFIPKNHQLNVLLEQKEAFESEYASIPKSLKYKYLEVKTKHRVKKGETLLAIAKKHNTTVNAIAKLNNIQDPRKIRAGQLLKIPGGYVAVAQKNSTDSQPPNFSDQGITKHQVREGQTLSTIAKKYNTTVNAIAKVNNIQNPRKLKPGQLLEIPDGHVSVAQKNGTESQQLPSFVHRVKKGQTLSTIAKEYNTTVKAIAKLNNIRNPRKIRAGQLLKIPEG